MENLELKKGMRYSKEEYNALEKAAEHDDRKPSTFARKIIVDYLKKKGWLG